MIYARRYLCQRIYIPIFIIRNIIARAFIALVEKPGTPGLAVFFSLFSSTVSRSRCLRPSRPTRSLRTAHLLSRRSPLNDAFVSREARYLCSMHHPSPPNCYTRQPLRRSPSSSPLNRPRNPAGFNCAPLPRRFVYLGWIQWIHITRPRSSSRRFYPKIPRYRGGRSANRGPRAMLVFAGARVSLN